MDLLRLDLDQLIDCVVAGCAVASGRFAFHGDLVAITFAARSVRAIEIDRRHRPERGCC